MVVKELLENRHCSRCFFKGITQIALEIHLGKKTKCFCWTSDIFWALSPPSPPIRNTLKQIIILQQELVLYFSVASSTFSFPEKREQLQTPLWLRAAAATASWARTLCAWWLSCNSAAVGGDLTCLPFGGFTQRASKAAGQLQKYFWPGGLEGGSYQPQLFRLPSRICQIVGVSRGTEKCLCLRRPSKKWTNVS